MSIHSPQPPDADRKKRVEVLYRGFGVPLPVTRSPFMFRRFVSMRSMFSFGFEDKDVSNNALLSRLWRWSMPAALMTLALLLEIGLFAGGGFLKYLVYTQASSINECFLFMVARGAAWGALMGMLTFWCLPWSVAQWRRRQVLTDIKLTALTPREILAAIWLPPLHLMIMPVFVFSALDFLIVPVGYLYLEEQRFGGIHFEFATFFGLLFQFSMIYMAMMIVYTAALRPSLRERSIGAALWYTLGWTIHHTAIAALKFFFNVFFIILLIVMCAGGAGIGLLLYGTWFGYHVCDGLRDTISDHLREAQRHWWHWLTSEE